MSARTQAVAFYEAAQHLNIGSAHRTDLLLQATFLATLAITEPRQAEPQPEEEPTTPKQAVEQAVKARKARTVKDPE